MLGNELELLPSQAGAVVEEVGHGVARRIFARPQPRREGKVLLHLPLSYRPTSTAPGS